MESPEFQELLTRREKTIRFLWVVFTGSILFYGGVGFVVTQKIPQQPDDMFAMIFPFLALGAAGLAIMFQRVKLSDAQLVAAANKPYVQQAVGRKVENSPLHLAELERIKQLTPRELKLFQVATHAFMTCFLVIAFNETIAVFGLVHALKYGNIMAFLPYALAAIVLNVVSFPRIGAIVDRAKSLPQIN